ncbi:hypothetical protein GCM10007978_27050 [Shewanella hanedai]|uniref:Uncharacterized protein n=1 Tax=Shewanella hanedai TaxID=25 RepID=A0A553JLS6_SHEHA|nr:hypothetical protein [Shewanella hanedai]TRY13412.1 hypothetical protein FN961_15390 [Shewanella hanedai]GGI87899.1 hypothetical protein GCM10007978_27050 [Shewanella hanedai]
MKPMSIYAIIFSALLSGIATPLMADTMKSRCDIFDKPQGELITSTPCTFSQRQGHISIYRDDGVNYHLSPVEQANLGTFEDENGKWVYRQSGLGSSGLIFKMPSEYLYLYWGKAD